MALFNQVPDNVSYCMCIIATNVPDNVSYCMCIIATNVPDNVMHIYIVSSLVMYTWGKVENKVEI